MSTLCLKLYNCHFICEMARKRTRIAVKKVLVTRVSRDIRNVFSHNYRKLNDRQSKYINRQVVTRQIFKVCNMPKLSLATCCKVLQEITTIQKSETARKCISPISYSLINICHATLVNQISGPNDRSPPTIVLLLEYVMMKGGAGIMYWLAILMIVV